MSRSVLIVDRFAPEAAELRAAFDAKMAEPRRARGDRFVWDYWHVPGQYTHLRTPAWTYFPRALYERFHRRLVAWGREVLGCHDVSPPWLSCYVDGCRQELHGDLPHGPWAFVFSLTNWRDRVFSGGETMLVRDDVLDYWHDFRTAPRVGRGPPRSASGGVEHAELVRTVEPKFGRLVAFDPRVPHGVREVRGTQDPRAGRLVVHGWFVQPRPFVSGPLVPRSLLARAHELGALVVGVPMAGMLALAFAVDRRGGVRDLRVLSDTTRVPRGDERTRLGVLRALRRAVAAWTFGRQRAASRVTLPLVFEVT